MNTTPPTPAAPATKYSATIEILRGQHAAIIALTDSRGEWSGAGRIDLPHGSGSDLYELGYIYASRSAAAKGGTLDRYSKYEEKPARFAPETCGYRRVPILERRPGNALNVEIGQGTPAAPATKADRSNRFQRIDRTGIIRDDGIGPLSGERQWIHVARIGDLSAQRINGYESKCGWCYLGAGHSQEAHAAAVSR